jgi:hypothetical protein
MFHNIHLLYNERTELQIYLYRYICVKIFMEFSSFIIQKIIGKLSELKMEWAFLHL